MTGDEIWRHHLISKIKQAGIQKNIPTSPKAKKSVSWKRYVICILGRWMSPPDLIRAARHNNQHKRLLRFAATATYGYSQENRMSQGVSIQHGNQRHTANVGQNSRVRFIWNFRDIHPDVLTSFQSVLLFACASDETLAILPNPQQRGIKHGCSWIVTNARNRFIPRWNF